MFGGKGRLTALAGLFVPAIVCVFWGQAPALAGEFRKADADNAIKHLYDEDPYDRKSGAYHLSEMGNLAVPAIPRLIELLKDPVACGESAETLAKLGPEAKAAVPGLIEFLKNKQLGYDRCCAASALGDIKSDPQLVIPVLVTAMQEDEEPVVRRFAADSLGKYGADAKDTVRFLIKAVKEGDKDMRSFASQSIGKIGGTPKDVPALIELLSDEIDVAREGAARALGKIGCESVAATPHLINLLSDQSQDVRRAAAEALGDIGPEAKSAISRLKITQKMDDDSWVQDRAREAIEKIENPRGKGQ